MSKGSFRPVELVPDWLMDSPITFDDLKCTSPPSTIFRMSLASSPGTRGRRRRSSIMSMSSSESEEEEDAISILSKPPQLPEIDLLVEDAPAEEQPRHLPEQDDGRSFLWDNDAADSDSDSDGSTLNDHDEFDPSPIDPFFAQPTPTPSPSPAPTRASSFDGTSPWFMHFDAAALSALDNQLLQSPFDAFSDLCYAQAVELEDASIGAIPGSYTWRRFSRLRPLSPFSEEDEEELRSELNLDQDHDADSESDTDSEQLASPEQAAVHQSWAVRPRVYSPTPASHSPHWHRHARHFQHDSDGSIHFRPQDVSLPLPSHAGQRLSKALPLVPSSPSPPATINVMDDEDPDFLRSATASPPPLFLPSPAVSQAQLAFLFSAPPNPGESVHFAPQVHASADHGKGRARRGTLRISTEASASVGASAGMGTGTATGTGTWFRRIRAGFSQGS